MSTDTQTPASPTRAEVVEWLQQRRARGNSYVSVRRLTDDFAASEQTLGSLLARLADDGLLEVWGEGQPKVYRLPELLDDVDPADQPDLPTGTNNELRERAVELAGAESHHYGSADTRKLGRKRLVPIAETLGCDHAAALDRDGLFEWLAQRCDFGEDGYANSCYQLYSEGLAKVVAELEAEVDDGE